MSLHPGVWVGWLGATSVLAFVVSNPWVLACALGVITLVHLAGPPDDSPAGRAFRTFLWIGGALVVLRVVFEALVRAPGETPVLSVPAVELPRWLGGVGLGGDVTAEVLLASATGGLRLLCVLAAFGIFNARVELARLVRLVPGPFRDAGLVVSIAAAFVPGLLRTVRDVADARRLRGESGTFRNLAPSVVIPVLGLSLERALLLAESMDSRGYGRAAGARIPAAPLVAGAGAVVGGTALWVAGAAGAATALVAAGAAGLIVLFIVVCGRGTTTHLAPPRWHRTDSLVLATCVAAVAAAVLAPGIVYDPYPIATMPPFDLAAAVPALLLAGPIAAELRR